MKFFTLSLCLFLLAAPSRADEAPPATAGACDDSAKIYKHCTDQQAAYHAELEAAKTEGKLSVLILGADWCPWCRSLHTMLTDPAFGGTLAKKYKVGHVGLYNGKEKLASGQAALKELQELAKDTSKIGGIPVLAMVNPAKGKAVLIDTEKLEKNTKTTKGHDPKKVLAALKKAEKKVR